MTKTDYESKRSTSRKNIGAKFEKETADRFEQFCRSRGEAYSNVIRRLVKKEMAKYGFLPQEQAQGFKEAGYKEDRSNES